MFHSAENHLILRIEALEEEVKSKSRILEKSHSDYAELAADRHYLITEVAKLRTANAILMEQVKCISYLRGESFQVMFDEMFRDKPEVK